MVFDGNMTRDQIVAVYESSDQSFNASMKCLGQGPTLESILFMLNVKMSSAEQVKLVLDPDDMADILVYYKSPRIGTRKQLHIKINNMAAIDTGGVCRQVYSTVLNDFHHNKYIKLFTGPSHSISPVYTAEARSTGLFKVLGTMVGHSVCQDGIGFPFSSLANYYYVVKGDKRAIEVCSINNVGADVAAVVSKVKVFALDELLAI